MRREEVRGMDEGSVRLCGRILCEAGVVGLSPIPPRAPDNGSARLDAYALTLPERGMKFDLDTSPTYRALLRNAPCRQSGEKT